MYHNTDCLDGEHKRTEGEAMKGIWNRLRKKQVETDTQSAVTATALAQEEKPSRDESVAQATVIFQHDVAYNRLKHAVQELQGAIKQLEMGLREIQEGQLQHVAGLDQTLATVEMLSATTQQVAASAQESAGAAQQADTLAEQGWSAVEEAHTQMARIAATVQRTGDTVIKLGQRASAITRIVDIIQEIASQTNLLSLNAAIEAARAGDAGRGFAVVADEVRKLSEQSAAQARQIADVVEEITREIDQVSVHMDESLQAVAAGNAVVDQAGQALKDIVEAAGQVSEMVAQISDAASEQAEGSQQIVLVSNSLADLSARVSYSIDKALMDATQQQAALTQLGMLTEQLGDICASLPRPQDITRPKQRFCWQVGSDPITLDPQLSNDMSTTYILSEVFVGLTRFGPDTSIIPGLAQAWDLSADGRTWTFQLRRGAKFHNGREVKARDIKYSLERVLRPETGSPNTWLVEMIEGAKDVMAGRARDLKGIVIKGDYTVQITLEKPYHPFLANLAYTGTSIMPQEVVDSGRHLTNPIGAGPFTLASYEPGKRAVLKAFTDFYGGRPFIDEIEILIQLPNNMSEVEALNTETIDLLQLNARNINAIKDHPVYSKRLQRGPVLRTAHIGLNCGKGGPLSNPLVRQAINLAINKQVIVDEIFSGNARIAAGPLPPGCIGYDERLAPYPFDLNAAAAKLREAGYPNGLPEPLVLHIREGNQAQQKQANLFKQWLGQIGIQLDIKELPWAEMVTTAAMRRCDMHMLTWIGDTGDPDNFLQPLFNSSNHGDMGNRTFFSHPEVDRLLEQGQAIRDPEQRKQHYAKLNRLIAEQAPWVFLCHDDQLIITQPYVKGFSLHPLGIIRLENVWLDKS